MYEERKDKFSFKSFFLTLLLVLLFVFLMLFLFPTRWDLNNKYEDLQSTHDIERLSVLYDEIFANNVTRMKDAAIGYFTDERMPQKVGESKKLTLQEMYDLHLVLKMKDKDGKACSTTKSYVEMTKYTEEYRLKVNLSCGDQEDYIIVYLGCYTYCSGGICEKRVPTPSETTAKEEQEQPKPTSPEKYYCKIVNGKYYDKNGNIVNAEKYNESCGIPPIVKKYLYEYKLETKDSTTCTNWSKWQKEAIEANDSIKVETKTEKELIGYTTTKVQTGTKVETITKSVVEKYISGYSTKLVFVGTKEVKVGTTTVDVTEKVAVGTVEVYGGIGSGTKVPKDTSTTKYVKISTDTPDSCSYCENETIYTWEIWNIETVYDVVTTQKVVDVYKTVNEYEEQQVPIYDYRTVEKKEKIETPIYEEIKIPQYEKVKYYRSRTCTFEPGIVDIKWSNSKMDSDLIGKGYKLTGNVKEA